MRRPSTRWTRRRSRPSTPTTARARSSEMADVLEITAERLTQLVTACGRQILAARAGLYAVALEKARAPAMLDTPRRVAHFMAQVAHESGGFGSLVESTRYSDPARLL